MMNNGTEEEEEEYYNFTVEKGTVQFYTNKIDSLINKIKNILRNDRDDPIIAEVIMTTPDYVKFHIYRHFLLKLVKVRIKQNIIDNDEVTRLKDAKTLPQLMGLLQSDDIFDGETHPLNLPPNAKIVKAAAIKAFEHVHNDKDPISQKFDWDGAAGKGTMTFEI
jgi:hypothetical protein